jgi:hypothetical protein
MALFTEYVPRSTQRIQSSMMSVYAPALEDVPFTLADFIDHLGDTAQ